jgi:hypothetical protein
MPGARDAKKTLCCNLQSASEEHIMQTSAPASTLSNQSPLAAFRLLQQRAGLKSCSTNFD